MIIKKSIKGLTKEAWLEIRKGTIGGSEIGAILGLNEFASAYSVWAEKMGLTPAFEGNLATDVGTYLEEFVAKRFQEISGLQVQKTNFIYYNDQYLGLHASPDRLIQYPKGDPRRKKDAYKAGLECKTTNSFSGKKFKGEDFPATYYCQAVQYMAVMDVSEWYIAVLIGNHDFRIYQLRRGVDQETCNWERPEWCLSSIAVSESEIASMYAQAKAFMACIATHTPPAADGSDATTRAIADVFGDSDPGLGDLDLTPVSSWIQQYKAISANIKSLDKEKTEAANMIKSYMGQAEVGRYGDTKVTWKTQTRRSVDTDRLLQDIPTASDYIKTSTSRTFLLK